MENQLVDELYCKIGNEVVRPSLASIDIRFSEARCCFQVIERFECWPESEDFVYPRKDTEYRINDVPLCTEFFDEQSMFRLAKKNKIDEYLFSFGREENAVSTGKYWWVCNTESDNALSVNNTLYIAEFVISNSEFGLTKKAYLPLLNTDENVSRLRFLFTVKDVHLLLSYFYIFCIQPYVPLALRNDAFYGKSYLFSFTFDYLKKR